ncbi:MAG TPA: methionine adenosyltransferase [Erysipelotrichaceae bacterium]|nr:methionine adenosyltransferase [Erysipelotrichaceae bacterium]HAO61265.1 methionine adenosyltransferase [Erysipelotrichaceae bacterium]
MREYLFTSESVTDGHPDKICDQIADSILDAALSQDPYSKMAVEATIKDDLILVYGEANTKATIDFEKIAKDVIRSIGYDEEYNVMVKVNGQSAEIFNAVTGHDEIAAGDQGIMFGYASNETENYMPLAIDTAHRLSKRLSDLKWEDKRIRPDGKTQVTVLYRDHKPVSIDTIVVSTQHSADLSQEELHEIVKTQVIDRVVDPKWITPDTKYFINPSGSFIVGGSFGDSGTTGRKIVVDTYGGMGRIGGGCFSSKDPSKVDRSAAYYSRFVAKNLVAAKLAERCEIQLSYAIGQTHPISIMIDTFNTNLVELEEIYAWVKRNFDFSVGNIIRELDLLKPIYRKTANFGHFGRDGFSWENIKTTK